jgi:hypothetical protein
MDTPETATISAELTYKEAYALAQFIKRSTFEDFRRRASSDDDAYVILEAISQLRKALASAGCEPT